MVLNHRNNKMQKVAVFVCLFFLQKPQKQIQMLTGTGALLYIATGSVPFCFRLTEMYVVIKKGAKTFFFQICTACPREVVARGGHPLGLIEYTIERVYRHSSIYAVNVGTHKKKRGKQKPSKSRLLSSTKGDKNRIE